MNKKIIILTLLLTMLAAGTFAFSNQQQSRTGAAVSPKQPDSASAPLATRYAPQPVPAQPASRLKPDGASAQGAAPEIPEEVVYGIMFRQITAMKREAVKLERRGQDAASLRTHVKKEAKLKDDQSQVLDRIALETEREVAKTDRQAKRIINAIRVRHPKGLLKDGEPLPLPPPELRTLNEQRKNIILQSRERLRNSFGEADFRQFDDFIKDKIARKIKKLGADSTNLTGPGLPREPKH